MWSEKEEAEYWDYLNGGRERQAEKRRKGERKAFNLWLIALSFLLLSGILTLIGQLVRYRW